MILTHTHAGVASIKKELRRDSINPKKFNVETISSFAQRYTNAFYTDSDVPSQEDSKKYHPFVVKKATSILSSSLVQQVIRSTYTGVFVDEYQDCTKYHHEMILAIGSNLPIRILGDPLQGIFDFRDKLVDFSEDLSGFEEMSPLSVPYRWKTGGNPNLGNSLKQIRKKLEASQDIDLNCYTETIEVVIVENEADIYKPNSDYRRKINEVRRDDNLLVIDPNSSNKNSRIKFSKIFKEIRLLESIDDDDFYRLSKIIDNIDTSSLETKICELSYELFIKSELNKWFNFNNKKLKRKKDKQDKLLVDDINGAIEACSSIFELPSILKKVHNLPGVSCVRLELLKSLYKAIDIARSNCTSVLDGMIEQRNNVRRYGREIEGRHIGTTLLTKGLEFDTVVVLNAHKFNSAKNLYVAFTRCRKRLVVFSENSILSPYS